MSKYYKRSSIIEAITFDELVQHGIENGGNVVNGVPWAFKYNNVAITHENDNCYLVASPIAGLLPFSRGDMLTVCGDGSLFPMSLASFCMIYAVLPEQLPASPPEQECEHRKLTYCHGSSLWVCADCDEQFNAEEYLGLIKGSLVDE